MTTRMLLAWVVMATIPLGCQTQTGKSDIYLENGGLCDTRSIYYRDYNGGRCYKFMVHGKNFSNSSQLWCHFGQARYHCVDPETGCTTHKLKAADRDYYSKRAEFINSTTVVCELYTTQPSIVSVDNQDYNYYLNDSNPLYLPYSSICQDCDATATCVRTTNQMQSYCFYRSSCFVLGDLHPQATCRECAKADNGTLLWSKVRSNECGYIVFPVWSIVLLVIFTIATVAVIGFLVYTCFSKTKDPSTYNRVEDTPATTPAANSPGQNEQA